MLTVVESIVVVVPNTERFPVTERFPPTDASVVTVKSLPIVTSSGKLIVTAIPPPSACALESDTVISFAVPVKVAVVLPSTAVFAVEP
mgnify:CR=1 FL=1